MIVYNLSEEEVTMLNDSATANAESYLDGSFSLESFLKDNDFYLRDSSIQIPDIEFNIYDDEPSKTDVENAIRLYEATEFSVAPYTASSGAFWTAMVHSNLEYMSYRWPLDEDQPEKRLSERYLLDWTTSRRSRERNGLSRLWWIVYLTILPEGVPDRYLLTKEVMSIQDVATQILDRDAFTPKVTRSFARVILAEHQSTGEKIKRELYRPLLRYVYTLDGTLLLDSLPEEDLVSMFSGYLEWYRNKPVQTGE